MRNIKDKNKKKKDVRRKGINAKLIRVLVFCFFGISIFSFIIAFSNTNNKGSNATGSRGIGNLGNAPGQFLITSADFKDKEKPLEIDERKEGKRTSNAPAFAEDTSYAQSYSANAEQTKQTKQTKENTPVQDKEKNIAKNIISSFIKQENLSPNTSGIYANMVNSSSPGGAGGVGSGFFGNAGSVMQGLSSIVDSTIQGTQGLSNNILANDAMSANTFTQEKSNRGNILESSLIPPASDRIIQAGTLIPLTMITGINSDIPGDIIGQVSRNVYDSIRGKYLLIPAGTKLLGSYNSSILYGQERLMVAWTRLIRPDGSSIDLQGMSGVDLQGYAGYSDRVDNHWDKILGALGIATIINIANLELSNQIDFLSQFSSSAAAGLKSSSSQVSDLAGRITDRSLNIQPTIKIKPGLKANLFISRDMIFSEVE